MDVDDNGPPAFCVNGQGVVFVGDGVDVGVAGELLVFEEVGVDAI